MKKVQYNGVVRIVADDAVNDFLAQGYQVIDEPKKAPKKAPQSKSKAKPKAKK